MNETQQKQLARYIFEYLAEEKARGNDSTDDDWLIWNAINSFIGGAR